MPELIDVRQAIADKLSVITGIQVSGYMLGNPTPPTGHVFPAGVEFDQANARGSDTWELTVQLLVAPTTDQGAQTKLDELLAPTGPRSVKAALEEERPGPCTLGGLVQDLAVLRASGYQRFTLDSGGEALGADWTVEIFASGA